MPMKTTFEIGRPSGASARIRHTWSTISAARRLRRKPMKPVAQKLHAIAQPTWVETHNVVRSSSGITTASIRAPSPATSTAFAVPSTERSTRSSSSAESSHSEPSRARSACPRSVICSGSSTPRRYSQAASCSAR